MVSSNLKSASKSTWPPTEETFARVIADMKAMTPAQRRESLVDAGIITKKGNYTKPYRVLGQSRSRATAAK
jgi:hypothetical protein